MKNPLLLEYGSIASSTSGNLYRNLEYYFTLKELRIDGLSYFKKTLRN